VAQDLGVGFSTLVRHLEFSQQAITSATAARLNRTKLSSIREAIAGFDPPHDLFVVDGAWGVRAVDMLVGDVLVVPTNAAAHGFCLSLEASPKRHISAVAAGLGGIELVNGRVVPVRVSRRGYGGLACYRFMEE
jgi:hypothetical protein